MANGAWHEQNGKFKQGNPGGGRKRRADEEEIRAALVRAKPRARVLEKLGEAIERRESWAIALYLAYDWGKPIERTEITGAEGGPVLITSVEFVGLDNEEAGG